jgi:hypothetical protein
VQPDQHPAEQRGTRLWHVTLTMSGPAHDAEEMRAALQRLAHERPFLLAGRYSADRAEVQYWEEADDVLHVVALAMRLWPSHAESCGLPAWAAVGLEIVDQDTFHGRGARGELTLHAPRAGDVRPF